VCGSHAFDWSLSSDWADRSVDPAFEAELEWAESTAVLTLQGSLEHNAILALATQIDQIFCSSFTSLVLEVNELRTIDDVGVRCLVELYHYVIGRGGQMAFYGADGMVASAMASSALVPAMSPPPVHTARRPPPNSAIVAASARTSAAALLAPTGLERQLPRRR
jgi:anti-anti-sigma factor